MVSSPVSTTTYHGSETRFLLPSSEYHKRVSGTSEDKWINLFISAHTRLHVLLVKTPTRFFKHSIELRGP